VWQAGLSAAVAAADREFAPPPAATHRRQSPARDREGCIESTAGRVIEPAADAIDWETLPREERRTKVVMKLHIGISGYSYPEWKGKFYPPKLPTKKMLGYYAEHFDAVELNYTFRRMPTESNVAGWLEQTPASFRFAPKVSQTITHFKRPKDVAEPTDALLAALVGLKPKLGPLLVQLPPNFQKDIARLDGFLEVLANRLPAAFEFRHRSWHDDEVYECLRRHNAALCIADTVNLPMSDIVSTTNWGYLRLRSNDYTDEQLAAWLSKIRTQNWREAYVYFMHEDEATGPEFALKMIELARP
jgi:uncharacterized protein YecE (DUF72 family)